MKAFRTTRLGSLTLMWSCLGWAAGQPSVPSASSQSTEPVVLHPVDPIPIKGWAEGRWRLSNGDLVQQHAFCSEWGSYTDGILVRRSSPKVGPRVIRFNAGRIAEINNHLLVEGYLQVGSDGNPDEEPLLPPQQGQCVLDMGNGAYDLVRLTAVDLSSGKKKETFFDAMAPATAGKGRFLVFAKLAPCLKRVDGTDASQWMPTKKEDVLVDSYHLMDLKTGTIRKLGASFGSVQYRITTSEVLITIGSNDRPQFLAVSGITGVTRKVDGLEYQKAPVGDGIQWLTRPNLTRKIPAEWKTSTGQPILVKRVNQYPRESFDNEPPRVGTCGVAGPWFFENLLFVDQGIYLWPDNLSLNKEDPQPE